MRASIKSSPTERSASAGGIPPAPAFPKKREHQRDFVSSVHPPSDSKMRIPHAESHPIKYHLNAADAGLHVLSILGNRTLMDE